MKYVACIALCAALLLGAQARASVVPAPGATKAGAVTIVTQPDSTASLAGVALFVRAGLDRQLLSQNGLAALTAESILQSPVRANMTLAAAVAADGGSISYEVEPTDVRFYLEGLASNESSLVGLLAEALARPDFSTSTLSAARASLDRKIERNQVSALQVGVEMVDRQFFTDANAGLPEYGTPASLVQLTSNDVQNFYKRTYHNGGAVISAVGALAQLGSPALNQLAGALPAGNSQHVAARVTKLNGTSTQLIAHRSISAPWLVAQYKAPSLDSPDFGAFLVLSSFINRTLDDVASVPNAVTHNAAERAVGTIYNFDQKPASLIVYMDGALGNPNQTFASALSVINILGQTKLQGSIDQFKTMAQGDYITSTTTLADRAWIAGVFAMRGGSIDYVNRTLAAISSVTTKDVQRVARKYLGSPIVALILPRENS